MSGIKYYQLKKDEELPDEFCAVRDVGGEPTEYTFYRPETENAKLRELASLMLACIEGGRRGDRDCWECPAHWEFDGGSGRHFCGIKYMCAELGVTMDG